MSRNTNIPDPSVDPMKAWREWFVQSERSWSQALANLMQDENVARTVGQEIQAGAYGQQMLTQGMAEPMAAMNLPTRADLIALGERLGQLEDAVARMEALLVGMAAPASARPARTRKAPAAPPPPADAGPAATRKAAAARKASR